MRYELCIIIIILSFFHSFFLSLSLSFFLSFVIMHGPGDPQIGPIYLRRRQLQLCGPALHGYKHNVIPACEECRCLINQCRRLVVKYGDE